MAEGWAREWVRQERDKSSNHGSFLDTLVIASVALDSSAVFRSVTTNEGPCCCDPCSTPKQRKAVKSKAVQAMAMDGVDIRSFAPKTLDEVLFKLQDASMMGSCSTNKKTRAKDDASFMIDQLVILCSCGDDIKHTLSNQSKHVREWNVDAPTACAKEGEGDGAYRRVSMEIKRQVQLLMEEMRNQHVDEEEEKEKLLCR